MAFPSHHITTSVFGVCSSFAFLFIEFHIYFHTRCHFGKIEQEKFIFLNKQLRLIKYTHLAVNKSYETISLCWPLGNVYSDEFMFKYLPILKQSTNERNAFINIHSVLSLNKINTERQFLDEYIKNRKTPLKLADSYRGINLLKKCD